MKLDPEVLIERYCKIARPAMLNFMPANACVLATRTTIAAMDALGLESRPLSVSWAFIVPARRYVRIAGWSAEEREHMKRRSASYLDLEVENAWNGHLIAVVANRWLLDPSIDQAASEDFGVQLPPEVLAIDTAGPDADLREQFDLRVGARLDNGDEAQIVYRTREDTSYLDTDSWRDIGTDILGCELARRVLAGEPA